MPPQPNPGNARVNDEKNTALMIAARDGDLARVQQILAALPGHRAPKLDLANKFGWRAIHFAAQNGNVEILNALVAAGADINITTKNTSTPLAIAIFYEKRPIVQRLIELGANVNIGGPKSKPLGLAFGMLELDQRRYKTLFDIAIDLLRANVDVEHLNYEANFGTLKDKIRYILLELGQPGGLRFRGPAAVPPAKVLELVTLLITRYTADMVAFINETGGTQDIGLGGLIERFYYPDILARKIPAALMRILLDGGMRLVYEGDPFMPRTPDNKNPILKARAGLYSPEMNVLITERFPAAPAPAPAQAQAPGQAPVAPPKMWKGWTRGDLDRFNSVFLENAYNISICPVCFKYAERQDGCMYMAHNCLQEQALHGGFVHKELYEKYKMVSANQHLHNKIEWCTVCGRICDNHRHYELLPPFVANPVKIPQGPGYFAFGNDCTKNGNNGGGLPEKVARYRRAREFALELQGQIDRITEDEAMKQIIEEMWKAPIARYERRAKKILEEGHYNIPNTNFPPNVAPAPAPAGANNAPAPNVQRPQANRNDPALRPTVVEEPDMMNALSLDDIAKGIKFHHRRPNGTIYHHEAPIGRPGFIAWFGPDGQDMAKSFATEEFGHCFDVDCGAILYPQELEPFVDTAEEEKFIPRDLFETYRKNFNRHMPARLAPGVGQGGYRRKHKTRKVKGAKRKQRGGQPHDMFLELETGQCLLPPKRHAVNVKGGYRKRGRRTRRR